MIPTTVKETKKSDRIKLISQIPNVLWRDVWKPCWGESAKFPPLINPKFWRFEEFLSKIEGERGKNSNRD